MEYSSSQNKIAENTIAGIQGLNSCNQLGYTGPYPSPGKPHRYIFRVFALDTELSLGDSSTKEDLESAMKGHVIAEGKLISLFSR